MPINVKTLGIEPLYLTNFSTIGAALSIPSFVLTVVIIESGRPGGFETIWCVAFPEILSIESSNAL